MVALLVADFFLFSILYACTPNRPTLIYKCYNVLLLRRGAGMLFVRIFGGKTMFFGVFGGKTAFFGVFGGKTVFFGVF